MSDDDIFGNPNGYDKNRDVKDIFSSNPNSGNAGSNAAFTKQENSNQYQKANVKEEQKEKKSEKQDLTAIILGHRASSWKPLNCLTPTTRTACFIICVSGRVIEYHAVNAGGCNTIWNFKR